MSALRSVLLLCWRDTGHPQGGGSEAYLQRIGAQLAASGIDVTLRTARYPGAARREVVDGVRIDRAGGRYSVYVWALLAMAAARLGVGPLRKVRPDVVVDTQNGLPFLARLVFGRRVVVLVHHCHRQQWPVAAPGDGTAGPWPRRWCAAAALGVALVAALPWLVASALGASLTAHNAANRLGVEAFAARAEPGLGTLASLASLGGIWNGDAVPASRATLFAVSSAVVLLGIVAAGLPAVARRPVAVPLLVLAAVSVLVPAALATGPGLHLLGAVVDAVPGFGVLRDGQKWVALAVPGYSLAGAGAVVTLRRWAPPPTDVAAALVCCLGLLLALPDLAWGVWGKVSPVHYPRGWAAVAAAINAQPAAVAVLPAGTMRLFFWSGAAPVLDPLPRWVRAEVLSSGDLVISGSTIAGEGAHAREVQRLLLAGPEPSALAAAGVGWLVVESDSAGDMGAAARTLGALAPVYRDDAIALYRVGGQSAGVSADRRAATVIAHAAWLALLVAGGAGAGIGAWRRRASVSPAR